MVGGGGGVSTRYSVRLCCTSYRKQRRQLGGVAKLETVEAYERKSHACTRSTVTQKKNKRLLAV